MKKILDMKKMSVLALGLVAFAPAASAQDEVETTIAADVVSQYILCYKQPLFHNSVIELAIFINFIDFKNINIFL